MSKQLNETSQRVIKDLQDDIADLSRCASNIELIWALEKLQNDKAFQKSADLIRKSLK